MPTLRIAEVRDSSRPVTRIGNGGVTACGTHWWYDTTAAAAATVDPEQARIRGRIFECTDPDISFYLRLLFL
jgi:hypothetical protein